MSENQRQTLQDQLRHALDERAASLDGGTRSRLNRARQAALDAAAEPGRRGLRSWPGLATASAAAAILAVLLWPRLEAPAVPPDELLAATFELIEVDEDIELVEEPEFYQWLDEQRGDGAEA